MEQLEIAEIRRSCMRVALGKEPADVVIRGGSVVDVHLGTVYEADVAVKSGRIAYVGDCEHTVGPGTEIVSVSGVLTPGFIDGHTHVGAAQFSLTNLAKAVVAHGTFAICVDFHIPGIVGGLPAIRHLLDEVNRTPLRPLFTVGYQMYTQNGPLWNTNSISGDDLLAALDWPEAIGISEWLLWFYAEPEQHPPAMQKLFDETWRRGLLHVGHAHTYPRRDLQAYAALDASSDHEAVSVEEIVDRLKLGIHVMVRTDYAERLMPRVVAEGLPTDNLSWATDGLSGAFVRNRGHIDNAIRAAIAAGLDPIKAVQMASRNSANYFGIGDDFGSIAPGRLANLVLVDALDTFNVKRVFSEGALVAIDGEYVQELEPPQRPERFLQTMNVGKTITPRDLQIPAGDGPARRRVRVIGLGDPITKTIPMEFELPVSDGHVTADYEADVCHISVLDRNLASGAIGNCMIHGLGITRGALGISSTGGAADIGVIGASPEDMAAVVNHLIAIGGGAAVAVDGEIRASVPMPVFGLFSDEDPVTLLAQTAELEAAIESLGAKVPLMRALRFSALPRAVPSWKVCQRGLCDVGPFTAELVPIFP